MNKIDSVEIHTEKQRTEDDKKYKEQIKTTQQKFAALNQLVFRDLNNDRNTPSFFCTQKTKSIHIYPIHIDTKHSYAMRLSICIRQVRTFVELSSILSD